MEAAVGRGVQRLTSRRLGERRADAVPGVGGDVLQIVAELQRDAPGESKLGRAWRERARGEPGVRKHRCPALLEDDFEEVARAGPSRAIELEAPLLRAMDGAQAGKYLGVLGAAVLAFDQANQSPGLLLMPPGGRKLPSLQASPETPVERVLMGFRNAWVVEVVVRTGVEHTVPENRGSQPRRQAQHNLEDVRRPRVAAGLEDVASAHGRIEEPGGSGEFLARFGEAAVEQQIEMAVLEIECLAREDAECGDQSLFRCGLPRPTPRRGAKFGFDGFEVAVEVRFAAGLLACRIAAQKGRRLGFGLAPPLEKAGRDGVPFVWHVSDYATQMSCAMFRGIGRPDWPLRCAVGERRITNAQALSDRPAKRKELVDRNN